MLGGLYVTYTNADKEVITKLTVDTATALGLTVNYNNDTKADVSIPAAKATYQIVNNETGTVVVNGNLNTGRPVVALAGKSVELGKINHTMPVGVYTVIVRVEDADENVNTEKLALTVVAKATDVTEANKVIAKIDALDSTKDTFAADVAAARTAFNGLTLAQKALVDEAPLKAAEKLVADRAAAAGVDTLIEASPLIADSSLTIGDKAAVKVLEDAYKALTADQKALVKPANVTKLNALVAKIAELEGKADAEAEALAAVRLAALNGVKEELMAALSNPLFTGYKAANITQYLAEAGFKTVASVTDVNNAIAAGNTAAETAAKNAAVTAVKNAALAGSESALKAALANDFFTGYKATNITQYLAEAGFKTVASVTDVNDAIAKVNDQVVIDAAEALVVSPIAKVTGTAAIVATPTKAEREAALKAYVETLVDAAANGLTVTVTEVTEDTDYTVGITITGTTATAASITNVSVTAWEFTLAE